MAQDPDDLIPVDEIFQSLLRKARAIQESNERLAATDAARVSRAALEANRIAARFEWKPRLSVALIEEQSCLACGNVTQLFRGFGVLMRRAADQTERILQAKGLDAGLPAERYILHSVSECCMECLPERKV